jgi:hypothetical protein
MWMLFVTIEQRMQSKAKTVDAYIASLSPERREMVTALRKVMRKNMPRGYQEAMQYGMMGYGVPHSLYPDGYLGRKDEMISYAGIASQKNYVSVYLMNVYGDKKIEQWFKKAYAATGKKLDMGKSCIRFRKMEDIPFEVIGKAVSLTPVKKLIEQYKKAHGVHSRAK